MPIVLVAKGTVHSSVALETLPVLPLKHSPKRAEPDPAALVLAVPKLFTSVHEVPLKNSVFAVLEPSLPPKAKAREALPLAP